MSNVITPRTLSYQGCQTRAEALARFDAWITAHLQEALLKFQLDVLGAIERGEILDDSWINAIEEAQEIYNRERLRVLHQHVEFFDEHVPDTAVPH